MPYRGNPSTDTTDQIRLLIGDVSTSTGSEIFADAEIDWFSATKPNVYFAAAMALETIAGTTRGSDLLHATRMVVGDLEIEYGAGAIAPAGIILMKARSLQAQGARRAIPFAGGISKADKDAAKSESDWVKPSFSVAMHDVSVSLTTAT